MYFVANRRVRVEHVQRGALYEIRVRQYMRGPRRRGRRSLAVYTGLASPRSDSESSYHVRRPQTLDELGGYAVDRIELELVPGSECRTRARAEAEAGGGGEVGE